MKLTSVKLSAPIAPPQHPLNSQGEIKDVYAAPEYSIETRGEAWLRITHIASGKSRLYPQRWCLGADEAPQEPGQQPQQGGRKR